MRVSSPVESIARDADEADLAVCARGLCKRFGNVRAVDGIDLDVPRGMIFAVLGPNGAGKTTLMRMLATITTPDAGTASVMGHDLVAEPHAVRAAIAMTGQFASLDEDLTGRENLILLARLWGFRRRAAKARADDLLAVFDLTDAAGKQVKSYSGGMRRRLDIAASLVVTPGVLFRKIAEGTSRELKAAIGSGRLHVAPVDPARLDEVARLLEAQLGGVAQRNLEDARLSIAVRSPLEANKALAALIASGIELGDFALGNPSLDEVFFALTGHATSES
jgi:ABC-2 type transport system ATP-binding protein